MQIGQHFKSRLTSVGWQVLGIAMTVALGACGADDSPSAASPPLASSGGAAPFAWPADRAVADQNHYAAHQDPDAMNSVAYRNGPNGGPGDADAAIVNASLPLAAIDETPAVKHHSVTVNGQTIQYTATAGHLVAWAPTDPANPAARDARASMFYMAYTRDDVPHGQRPVTFVFNGGPGEPSIWMHLGAWGPKRLDANAPSLPSGPDMPDSFPLVDDTQTLLDQTDLVYIDIVGSGFSEAISPHRNADFWNTDDDAAVFRDFVTAYINRYNRQSSPKYLMGESYAGIRTPVLADLLVKAGTSQYAPDPSGARPVVLTGMILQSPVLDYGDLSTAGDQRRGILPTIGMVVDYYGKSTAPGHESEPGYASFLRDFSSTQYAAGLAANGFPAPTLSTLSAVTGLPAGSNPNWLGILGFSSIANAIYPNLPDAAFDDYDGRISKPQKTNYSISFYEDAGFFGAIKPLLADEFGYRNRDQAQIYGSDIAADYWNWQHLHRGSSNPSSVPDLVETLTLDPSVKVLVFHGYDDSVTPFYQTELDLSYMGLWPPAPNQASRISIKDYDGGHMAYLTNASRDAMRADLRAFYASQGTASSRQLKTAG